MNSLVFSNDFGVRVEYKTDILDINHIGNFTVMQITGLSDPEITKGINFRELPYSITDFKQFASDHHLKLEVISPAGSTTIADHTNDSGTGSISIDE